MRAGRLRHRLELYSKEYTQDSYGAAITTITLQDTVWGGIEPIRGRELFAQQQIQSEIEVRIMLRYTGSLNAMDTSWVIKHPLTGKFYDVLAVINTDTRNREWELMCRQGMSEDRYAVTANVLYDVDGNALQFVGGIDWHTVD